MARKNPHAVALGRKGGRSTSGQKQQAARANGAKGGRPYRDKRIDRIEHDIDGWWIYLKPGFIVADERTHAIVEDTKRQALDKMFLVEPCECDDCKAQIQQRHAATPNT